MSNVDRVNDQLQQSTDASKATALLETHGPAMLRALCDLNYLDTVGRKTTLVRRLVNDRHDNG